MGAFFVVREDGGPHPLTAVLPQLRAHFQKCGFAAPFEAKAGDWRIAVYPKRDGAPPQVHEVDNRNFVFASGTLIYRSKVAREALAQIWADRLAGRFARPELRGAYALGICVDGELSVAIDALGTYKVYCNAARTVVASAFLAVLAATPQPKPDVQGLYEYVFQAATYGGRTVIEGISLLDHRQRLTFGAAATAMPAPDEERPAGASLPFAAHLERSVAALRQWFGEIVACFGDRIDTALSGGYDSRLILALLRDRGASPRIHVYGATGDEDVRIARRIAEGEGLPLLQVDKSRAAPPGSEAMSAIVARNADLLDAYPVDGIFDSGADVATRIDRASGGALALNGGGGEIFRNFFYLPDRSLSLGEFIWTFYSQFDPASATDAFSERDYMNGLSEAVQFALGAKRQRLSRRDVERLYPAFRCRYWTGRNTSVNNRFGWALTPFLEQPIVAGALDVPIAMKNHGRFQAALIKAVSPSLAGYESAYGHDFAGTVPLRRRFKDHLTLLRPPALRRYAFRIKARRQPPVQAQADRSWQAAVDPAFPSMRRFFRMAEVRDRDQFLRICTLEHLYSRGSTAP